MSEHFIFYISYSLYYRSSKVIHKNKWFSALLAICSFQLIKHAAIKSTLELGVHRGNNFQRPIPVKNGKSSSFPGRVALFWLSSVPEREPRQTDSWGLGSCPGTPLNFCCALRLAVMCLLASSGVIFFPRGSMVHGDTECAGSSSLHKRKPRNSYDGQREKQEWRKAVFEGDSVCDHSPSRLLFPAFRTLYITAPPYPALSAGLSITHSLGPVGSPSGRL